ncbi:MAG: DsrE/DsrF/DrsH-like family protein [Bacteroidales bacterium]|nr:DsrE/DsrF/DrsH-like family protein [Bacteroidales bacterium]
MENEKKHPLKKILLICSKANLEDVYAALVMANGAVMEGIEAKLFFTFFGLDAITSKRMNKLHTSTVGNPGMRMPGGMPFPTMLGGLPGVESGVTAMMKKEMERLDMPPVDEFLELIEAGGGEIYACKLAADMFKLTKEDMHPAVKDIITVGDLYAMCDGEGTQIVFT